MGGRLADRRALITGAARGMGRAIATAFAAEGAHLLLLGRTEAGLRAVAGEIEAAGGEAETLICDLADRGTIADAVQVVERRFGRVDILVNNAGISGAEAPFLELDDAAWDAMMAVNLTAPFLLSRAMARLMARDGRGGAILHNASIAGLGVDGPYAHYSVTKAGILALTRSMAVELAPHHIRVNAVSPGYTRTDMTMEAFDPATRAHLQTDFARVPIRRVVEPEEVARAFVFLASDEASGVTGTNLVVDGGLTANLYIMETLPRPA